MPANLSRCGCGAPRSSRIFFMSASTISLPPGSRRWSCVPSRAWSAPCSRRRGGNRPRSGGNNPDHLGQYPIGRLLEALLFEAASTPSSCRRGRKPVRRTRAGVGFSGCKQIVVGLVLLQHEPHSFGEVARVVSIAFDVEVAQQQLLLQAVLDRRNRPCDLAVTKVSSRIGLS